LALAEEMEQLALTAPDGEVFQICEDAVVEKGRKFNSQALAEAVTRRIEVAEKRGADPLVRLRSQKRKPRPQRTPTDECGGRSHFPTPLLQVYVQQRRLLCRG
jgi:hypothetical protein